MGRPTTGPDAAHPADALGNADSELIEEVAWPCYEGPQTFECELNEDDSAYVLGAMQERGISDREMFTRDALINHSHA
jgi:hypothetical protein